MRKGIGTVRKRTELRKGMHCEERDEEERDGDCEEEDGTVRKGMGTVRKRMGLRGPPSGLSLTYVSQL